MVSNFPSGALHLWYNYMCAWIVLILDARASRCNNWCIRLLQVLGNQIVLPFVIEHWITTAVECWHFQITNKSVYLWLIIDFRFFNKVGTSNSCVRVAFLQHTALVVQILKSPSKCYDNLIRPKSHVNYEWPKSVFATRHKRCTVSLFHRFCTRSPCRFKGFIV